MKSEFEERVEGEISIHIFSVSAAMVGVCLTVIGIIRVVVHMHEVGTLADDLLSFDALLFLGACLLSYAAMRTHKSRRMLKVERIADYLFILALLVMAIACSLITYAVI